MNDTTPHRDGSASLVLGRGALTSQWPNCCAMPPAV